MLEQDINSVSSPLAHKDQAHNLSLYFSDNEPTNQKYSRKHATGFITRFFKMFILRMQPKFADSCLGAAAAPAALPAVPGTNNDSLSSPTILRWEFIKENKKESFSFFLGRFLGRERVFFLFPFFS